MSFLKYWNSLTTKQKEALAADVGATYHYVKVIAYGREPSLSLALAIDEATEGRVPFYELCPSFDWNTIRRRLSSFRQQ